MQIKSQPWIHSWYGDLLGFHLIPLIFAFLAFMRWPPFQVATYAHMDLLILGILLIDWAHIFAQWHRIYYNPVETIKAKWIYPISYILLIPIVGLYVYYGSRLHVEVALVYFVIFHFIKQHFGFLKIYSKIDGAKTKFESLSETALFYLCMWTPVIYWHISFPKKDFYWAARILPIPYINVIFNIACILYTLSAAIYVVTELRRWKRNGIVNIPKNLALIAAALAWGGVSLFSDVAVLVMFTVVLTHDVSYTILVWMTCRRDEQIVKKKVDWFSWWSAPGFLFYVLILVLGSHLIMVLHLEIARNAELDYAIYGKIFNNITSSSLVWQHFGWGLFFATQAHHYFIDKFLWKKEKDLSYMVMTGKFQVEKQA